MQVYQITWDASIASIFEMKFKMRELTFMLFVCRHLNIGEWKLIEWFSMAGSANDDYEQANCNLWVPAFLRIAIYCEYTSLSQ